MLEPVYDSPDYHDWGENDWERFLQRADVRVAKYQELFETLIDHPECDRLIAREMGWEHKYKKWGCDHQHDCSFCEQRFDCESYEMLQLVVEPENIEDDSDADDLIACFDEVRVIPAYCVANEFAARLEGALREHAPAWIGDEDVRSTLFAAQMVPAQIAGGHGIGYERDSLCGNIANCKRALRNLAGCREHLGDLAERNLLPAAEVEELKRESEEVCAALDRWIESLRARVWWR